MNYHNILNYFKKKQPKLTSTKSTHDAGYIRALVTFTDRNTCEMMIKSEYATYGVFNHNGRKYHRYVTATKAKDKLQRLLSNYREAETLKEHPGFLLDTTNKYHDLSVHKIESVQIMELEKKDIVLKTYSLEK